jgi:hypothetical protein
VQAKPLHVLAFLALALGAPHTTRGQGPTTYSDPRWHWSIDLPPGWNVLPQSAVDTAEALRKDKVPNANFEYVAAFGRAEATTLTYPYILVQVTHAKIPRTSISEIADGLGAVPIDQAVRESGITDPALLAGKFGKPIVDPEHNRMVCLAEMPVAGVGQVKTLLLGYFGRDYIVQLNCYALAPRFDETRPLFDQAAATFRFDEGYAYQPLTTGTSFWKRVLAGAGVGAILGALLGAAFGLHRALSRRAKPGPAPARRG